MTSPTFHLPPDFFWNLLGGMLVNLHIAVVAFVAGFIVGVPLALAQLGGGVIGKLAGAIVSLMRAAPTFVVMFFLLNVIPSHMSLWGISFTFSGVMIVALALVPYSAYYIAESALDALTQLRRHSPLTALLFLPNVGRAFFVLVMASSTAAAIGVREAIGIIIRQAERMPSVADQFALFALGILLFGITLQAGFAVLNLIRRRLASTAVRRMAARSQAETPA
jgi:hypothetical protein